MSVDKYGINDWFVQSQIKDDECKHENGFYDDGEFMLCVVCDTESGSIDANIALAYKQKIIEKLKAENERLKNEVILAKEMPLYQMAQPQRQAEKANAEASKLALYCIEQDDYIENLEYEIYDALPECEFNFADWKKLKRDGLQLKKEGRGMSEKLIDSDCEWDNIIVNEEDQ